MVRKTVFILLLVSISSFSREYSLNELIDSAYKHSHLLSIADLQMEKNRDLIEISKRNLLPTVMFFGQYDYAITPYNPLANIFDESFSFTQYYDNLTPIDTYSKRSDLLITEKLDELLNGFSVMAPRNSVSGGIDLRQTFFAQNKVRHSIEYARVQGRALICSWQDVRMRIKANMTKLYYSALIAGEQVLIEKQSQDIAGSRHEQNLLLFNSQIL